MSEEESRAVRIVEAQAELARHIEKGSARLRGLSIATVGVAGLLVIAYLSQIAYPFATGVTTVTVDLTDPLNLAVEALVLALALLWVYVGLTDYLFSKRLAAAVALARAEEKELEAKIGHAE
jgi:hypothetical protein